jgi:large subunit ribosomal protein L15
LKNKGELKMKLNELAPAEGSKKKAFRKGRGHGSGNGKTAGRGANGQNSRSGGGVRVGFEGGQMPLYRRMPKVGFNNKRFQDKYAEVNIEALNIFNDKELVDEVLLREAGLVKGVCDGIVILGRGELTKNLTVRAERFTKSAAEKIQAAGGKAEVV